jgi:hypothetical protein
MRNCGNSPQPLPWTKQREARQNPSQYSATFCKWIFLWTNSETRPIIWHRLTKGVFASMTADSLYASLEDEKFGKALVSFLCAIQAFRSKNPHISEEQKRTLVGTALQAISFTIEMARDPDGVMTASDVALSVSADFAKLA